MTPTKLNVVYVKETGHVVAAATRTTDPAGLIPTTGGVVLRAFDGAKVYEMPIVKDMLESSAAEYITNGDRPLLGAGSFAWNDSDKTVDQLSETVDVTVKPGGVEIKTGVPDARQAFILLSTESAPLIVDVVDTHVFSYGSQVAGDTVGVVALVKGFEAVVDVQTA